MFPGPFLSVKKKKKCSSQDFPGGPEVKNCLAIQGTWVQALVMGMKIPHASEQLSQCTESPPNGIVGAISFYPEPRAPFISKVQAFCMLSSGTLHPLICSRNSSRSPFLSGPELLPLWTLAGKMVEEPSLNSFSFWSYRAKTPWHAVSSFVHPVTIVCIEGMMGTMSASPTCPAFSRTWTLICDWFHLMLNLTFSITQGTSKEGYSSGSV